MIDGSKSVTISKDIGAGDGVYITSGGPLTISGNVISDLDGGGAGGIYIYNNGANAPTTISGLLGVPASSDDGLSIITNGPTTLTYTSNVINVNNWVVIRNEGTGAGNFTTLAGFVYGGDTVEVTNTLSKANKPLTISGDVVAYNGLDVNNYGASAGNTTTISGTLTSLNSYVDVYHLGLPTGKLTISGSVSADTYAYLFSDGHAQIGMVDAGIDIYATVYGTTFNIDGPWTAGNMIDIYSPIAQTKLTPAAVLTAPSVYLDRPELQGRQRCGQQLREPEREADGADRHQLPRSRPDGLDQRADRGDDELAGELDGHRAAVHAGAGGGQHHRARRRVPGGQPARAGRRVGGLGRDDDAVHRGAADVGRAAGGRAAGQPGQPADRAGGRLPGSVRHADVSLFGPPQAFQWPGGAVFKAGTTLQTFTPIYNAWSVASPPFGGVFFEAPYIAMGGIIATSGTAWANFSTQPVTGDPVVYQIRQLTPTAFGFVATTEFVHNTYSFTVTGGAPCVVTGPTTWTACP